VVYQARLDPLEYLAKKANLALQASAVAPAAPEETDWRAPQAIRVLLALKAPTEPLANAARRAEKASRETLAQWGTLANLVAMELSALLEPLAWRALMDLQVTPCPCACPRPFVLTTQLFLFRQARSQGR
jgi:hypothetical protein